VKVSIEINIVCDMCSAILVAASSVGEARCEGKRDKTVFTLNKKDLCPECYERYRRNINDAVKGAGDGY
jgi:hypothetical protein